MTSVWWKCLIILQKHLLVRIRHFVLTALEILLPILLTLLLLYVKAWVEVQEGPHAIDFSQDRNFRVIDPMEYTDPGPLRAIFVPDNAYTRSVASYWNEETGHMYDKNVNFDYLDQPSFESGDYQIAPDIIIEFQNKFPNNTLPEDLHYCIHGNVENATWLGIVFVIALHFISAVKGHNVSSEVTFALQQFPQNRYNGRLLIQRILFSVFLYVLPLFFAFLVPVLVTQMVKEKHSGIKELTRLMGLPVYIHWFGFFVNALIVTFVSALAIAFLLTMFGFSMYTERQFSVDLVQYTSPPMLGKTAWFHVLIVLVLYILSSIAFCIFLSALFDTAIKATLCGLLLWVISYMGPLFGTSAGAIGALTFHEILLWSLLPNMALFWSLRFIGFQEEQGGLRWKDYHTPPSSAEDTYLLPLLCMFVVDMLLYLFIGWYFDQLFPGKYGISRPWYFLGTDALRCSMCLQNSDDEESLSVSSGQESSCFERICLSRIDAILRVLRIRIVSQPPQTAKLSPLSDYFESDPSGLQKTIAAVHLTKIFRPGLCTPPFLAVDNVSVNAYEGEIFVLLGHNGAGKTVTLSMLTGIYAPTRGTVIIKGYDVRKQISKAREVVGYCPQESMFFSELTVKQHLTFFGKLKGLKGRAVDSKVKTVLTKLKLWEKKDKRCSKLSGGTQRRVQFAISIIGNVQLLVLDEPSSGLDPENRRILWDMLLQLRHICCILLTTHHMEEADALADRIAIMARGKIVCCGSPMFLRKICGSDYIMKISKAVGCDATEVLSFVKRFVPTATIDNETHTEISLKLPVASKGAFSTLFRELEKQLEQLNIGSFGLGTLGLDEVFIRVNEMVEKTDKSSKKHEIEDAELERLETSKHCRLCCLRFGGLMMKRVYYTYHRITLFVFKFFFVILLVMPIIYLLDYTISKKEVVFFENIFVLPRLVVFEYHNTTKDCLAEAYVKNIPENVTVKKVTEDLMTAIMEFNERDQLGNQFEHYVLAASFESTWNGSVLAKALFDDRPGFEFGSQLIQIDDDSYEKVYTIISSLNLVHNAVLQNCDGQRRITVKLQIKASETEVANPKQKRHRDPNDEVREFCAGVLLGICLCLTTCTFVLLVVHERIKQFKHLQIMTGIGNFYFWGTAFLFDFFVYLVYAVCILIMLVMISRSGPFDSPVMCGCTFLAMMMFGWTAIPFAYWTTLNYDSPTWAYVMLLGIHLLSVIVLSIVRLILGEEGMYFLQGVLDCLPGCAVQSVLYRLCTAEMKASYSNRHPDATELLTTVASTLWVMFFSGLAYMVLLLALDLHYSPALDFIISAWSYLLCGKSMTSATQEEPDVEAETKRIKSQLERRNESRPSGDAATPSASSADNDALIVHNLSKQFENQLVVHHLTFGVRPDECFGLLGVNGAGKTTTFRMLTGALPMDSGIVYLLDTSLRKNRSKYMSKVGYCPQFHAHIDQLTCREILLVFAKLRGIKGDLKKIVNAYINQFGLSEHFWKRTADCSRGTNRKLSTALAFVGAPDLVMLDEPTTGVDPGAKRVIWNVIAASKTKGTSVILSSHSMDECEILCTRLAIMKKGKFKCIGSGQYLKSKFGKGFNVSVKLAKESDADKIAQNRDALVNLMESQFTGCKIIDEHEGFLEYSVPVSAADWHKLFTLMEEAKTKFNLEDYSVIQATLEQVFLAFASES